MHKNISKKYLQKTLFFLLLTAVAVSCNKDELSWNRQSPLKRKDSASSLHKTENRFHDIYELYKERVALISTEKKVQVQPRFSPFFDPFFGDGEQPQSRKETGLGSGFFISADGYICTNYHVVAEMDSVKVKFENHTYEAKLIGGDAILDVALLKIEPREGESFQPVFLGDSDRVKVGDWAIAIGNPFGLDRTFTLGVISATVRRGIDAPGNSHIQTDASINPGNSGGPLINLDGEVIGVNRMIYSESGGDVGIGFAIPINTAVKALEEIKKHGKVIRGFIGVEIADLTEEIAAQLGLKITQGALVTNVVPGSPAQKGGLKRGDVIVKINNRVIRGFSDLLQETASAKVGSKIAIEFLRGGRLQKIKINVIERP